MPRTVLYLVAVQDSKRTPQSSAIGREWKSPLLCPFAPRKVLLPAFQVCTFASYIRDRSSQSSCANQSSTCHFRMKVEIWLKKGQDCPFQPLITKYFCTWCNVLQVHSPPSQLLPIRGNLGNMRGNWRALLPTCDQRRLLLQVGSSQILHLLLRRERLMLIMLLRLMQMQVRKTPSPSASHHNQIQLCTCDFGERGRWKVGDGCRGTLRQSNPIQHPFTILIIHHPYINLILHHQFPSLIVHHSFSSLIHILHAAKYIKK